MKSNKNRRPQTAASGVSGLQRGEEEQEVKDEDAPCVFTEDREDGDAPKPDHRETVIAFWGHAQTKTRTKNSPLNAVLRVEEDLVTPDTLTLEKVL